MPLTDKLRAAVYARDKAICAFSGLSLWLLDYGTAPHGQPDWADHIRPVSRGGSDTLENLVCASHFHNRKKLNNSSDATYLFLSGKPTEDFFWTHGVLTREQAEVLQRHEAINHTDWYFNRAIFNLRVAMHDEWSRFRAQRDARFWRRSALKRILMWRKLSGESSPNSFLQRGLVRYPRAPDVKLMLELTRISNSEDVKVLYEELLGFYRSNATAMERFVQSKGRERRLAILRSARPKRLTEPMLAALKTHLHN